MGHGKSLNGGGLPSSYLLILRPLRHSGYSHLESALCQRPSSGSRPIAPNRGLLQYFVHPPSRTPSTLDTTASSPTPPGTRQSPIPHQIWSIYCPLFGYSPAVLQPRSWDRSP